MKKSQSKILTIIGVVAVIFVTGVFLLWAQNFSSMTFDNSALIENISDSKTGNLIEKFSDKKAVAEVTHYVPTPEQVKAIYMSACVAATENFRNDLVRLVEETELNSIIIDIKDYTGTISFDSGLEGDEGSGCRATDMKEFIADLHSRGIYVIGRVTVFQDPFYADRYPELAVKKESDGSVWSDHKGIHFVEVGAREYWDYIIELAKISHGIGFDEINFDYIRFPSDGNMQDIYFPFSNDLIESDPDFGKSVALEEFFKYLYSEISKYNNNLLSGQLPMITSADLFGMVTTNYDDLNIGQVLEKALPYFDYIAPMVYPSHYPDGFNGWSDPNKVPGELIHFVMEAGVERVEALKNATSTPENVREKLHINQLRPWLQDFDYGGDYDIAEVRAQIEATYDVGLNSWMLWAPSNRYTRGALKEPNFIDEIRTN